MTSFLAPEFAVRHRIAKDYCRVVAAIDDEIFQEGRKNDRLLSEEFFSFNGVVPITAFCATFITTPNMRVIRVRMM